jgi:hypothetical protein
MRGLVGFVLGAVVAFGVVTLVALEGRQVVVVETRDASGTLRRTRAWIADEDGASWIEAANPDRPFLHDVERDATVTLERGGQRRECRAAVAPNPGGHQRIRRLLSARYGWADRWIGLVADTSASLAIRLECP